MKQKKPIKPVKAWAATLADEPQIFSVSLHREDMPEHFRHIRVMVTPIERKRKKPVARKARVSGTCKKCGGKLSGVDYCRHCGPQSGPRIESLPPGPFGVILADPPWSFKVYGENGQQKAPDAHYKTMTARDMASLPVNQIAARDSLLAMWVYDPMLPDAIDLARAWGFEFVTVLFRWLKGNGQGRLFDDGERLQYGLGYHTRGGGCEECWLFKRGKGLPVLRHDIRKEFYSNRREHSRKPDEVCGWLVDLYGDVPRIELFARTTAPGWVAWGNETQKFSEAAE